MKLHMSHTALICTVIVIAVTVYDVIAVQTGGVDISVSAWFRRMTQYPVITFGFGFLCGHFLGPMTVQEDKKPTSDRGDAS